MCSLSARSLRRRARICLRSRRRSRRPAISSRSSSVNFPGDARLPELDLSAFQLPQNLPLSLPSDLVRQRPDIRAAESVLRQTNARIGVAQALMFPQLTLSGSYGAAATTASNLFNPGTQIWNIGASLLQPIFHAGQLQARKRGAEAAYDQVLAQEQQTVTGAFQAVA